MTNSLGQFLENKIETAFAHGILCTRPITYALFDNVNMMSRDRTVPPYTHMLYSVRIPNKQWQRFNYRIHLNATPKFYFSLLVFRWGSIQILSVD